MTELWPRAVLAILLLAGAPLAAQDRPAKGEAELAEMLAGRVAGSPVDCISDSDARSMQIVDGTAFVFGRGRTLYVNRPASPAMLDDSDLPVFEKWGSQLCRLDHVELRDRLSHIGGPTVFLDSFVPYSRPSLDR
jgi:hypothetical protein